MRTREPIEDKRVLRKMPDGTWVVRPDIPRETSEVRVVDLRHDGIACIPALECVRKKAFKGTTCAEHVHDGCMEIVFCQRGTLVFEGMGITYPFHPGMVFVSRPDEPHRLSSFPQGMFIYNILVRIGKRGTSMLGLPSREADCLRDRLLSLPKRLFFGGDNVRFAFQCLFRAYDEEERNTPWRRLRLKNAVMDLLFAVIDAANTADDHIAANPLADAIAAIRANPAVAFTLDELAARTHLSPHHLVRQFKRFTGLPPLAFRNSCRTEQAKRELANRTRSIGSIAVRLGYSSTQNFATSFRVATGKTPSAWRSDCLHS